MLPGVLLLIFTTRGTPGVIGDSVWYLAAATSVATGGALEVPIAYPPAGQFDADGHLLPRQPFVHWPPGYALLVALVMRATGMSALGAALVVNVVSLAVFLLCVQRLVERAAGAGTGMAVAAVTGVLPAVQPLFRMALSEAPFLAATGLALTSLSRWIVDPGTRLRASWVTAICIGVAIHLRFTGVFLAVVHALAAAWVLWRTPGLRPRWPVVLVSVAAGPVLGTIFLWHRLATLGCMLCAPRSESLIGVVGNVRDMAAGIVRSLPVFFDLAHGPMDTIASVILLAVLVALAVRMRAGEPAGGRSAVFGLTIALVVIYAAGLVTVRTFVDFTPLNRRLVAPVALPLIIMALAVVFHALTPRARRNAAVVMTIAYALGVAAASQSTRWRILREREHGDTPLMAFAASHVRDQPGVFLFSTEALYIATHVRFDAPAYWLPARGLPRLRPGERGVVLVRLSSPEVGAERIALLDREGQRIASGPDFLAWALPESRQR